MQLNAATRLASTEVTAGPAEQAIRKSVNEAPNKPIGKPFPVVTHFNGRAVPFLATIVKLPSVKEQQRGILSKIYLSTVKWGVLIKGDAPSWIEDKYILDGKNSLKPNGLPRTIDEHAAKEFFHTVGLPMPHH
jgi:hypothetical protein